MRGWTADTRVRQVAIAAAILAGLGCGVVALLVGWRSVPGVAGEWLGMLAGVMSTPFFLEASFVMVGVLIVLALNAIQRQRDGDDFISLKQLEQRDRARDKTIATQASAAPAPTPRT